MKKTNKYSLVVIILLLIIFLPLTIYGYIYKQNNKVEENSNHEFKYNGKLWFYDKNDNLLGNYECQNEICELAKSDNSLDQEYNINYYKDGNKTNIDVIEDTFVLIRDGDYINLFDLKHGKVIQNYISVNNYNMESINNLYILKNKDNLEGVLYISASINLEIPFEYNFIGLANKINNGQLLTNKFIVKKDSNWFLVNNNNDVITSLFEETIIDYNDQYIITYNNSNIKIYDYEKNQVLNNIKIDKYLFENNYIGIIGNNNLYIYRDLKNNYIKKININNSNSVELKYLDNTLYIYENNVLIDTYNGK